MSTTPTSLPQVVIRNVGLGGISVRPDAFQRDPKAARALVKAVRHHGATLPLIVVRERGGDLGYDLIDGLTALMAAKILKLNGGIRSIVLPENRETYPTARRRL